MYENLFSGAVDAYIIFNPVNRFYFTKFNSSFGCLILTKDEKIFLTDPRYDSAARQKIEGVKVITAAQKTLYALIKTELERLQVKSIGYEDKFLTVAEFKDFNEEFSGFKMVPVSENIEHIRLIKTQDEINKIAEAQNIAQKSLKKVIPFIKQGITERELAAELMFECFRNGAEDMSFQTIVAFGENSANPHHAVSSRRFEKNDVVLIDFGVKYQGYCSDMTRTFCLNEPRDEIKKMHSLVLEAQSYALRNIKAGITAHEADSLAREYLKANGYGKEFSHTLGHGVGLEIHEQPRIGENSSELLLPGMVITIEPGVYSDGIGGVRIEDMVVIKENGVENLTNFDKELEF